MPQITFFLIDLFYKVIAGRPTVVLYGKTPRRAPILVHDTSFEPYLLARIHPSSYNDFVARVKKLAWTEEERRYAVTRTELVKRKVDGYAMQLIKVHGNVPKAVGLIKNEIQGWDIVQSVYEHDVSLKRSYLIDKGIFPLRQVTASGDFIRTRSKVQAFQAVRVEPAGDEFYPDPSILAMDVGTMLQAEQQALGTENPIVLISLYSEGYRKVITWKRHENAKDYVEFVGSEHDLIMRFKDLIDRLRPDILVGFHSDMFDLPYLIARARKYSIRLDIGIEFSPPRVRKNPRSVMIAGINHIDLANLGRGLYPELLGLEEFDLESVRRVLLKAEPPETGQRVLVKDAPAPETNAASLCAKEHEHARLIFTLSHRLMPYLFEVVRLVGFTPYSVAKMNTSMIVEAYLMRQTRQYDEVILRRPGRGLIEQRSGTGVRTTVLKEAEEGISSQVALVSYASSYPHIIIEHNISMGALRCHCCRRDDRMVPDLEEETWFCQNRRGFIPHVVQALLSRLETIEAIIASGRSSDLLRIRKATIEQLLASSHMAFSHTHARWYSYHCAQAVHRYAAFYTTHIRKRLEEKGIRVLYATESQLHVSLEGSGLNWLRLALEGAERSYPRVLVSSLAGPYLKALYRTEKEGDRTRTGYALMDDDGTLTLSGLGPQTRTLPPIARLALEQVISILFRQADREKAATYIRTLIKQVRQKTVPKELMTITTALSKDIDEYDTVAPHVAVAKRMRSIGIPVEAGHTISYIVTAGPDKVGQRARLPSEVAPGGYDPEYYIESHILPAIEPILGIVGMTREDLELDREQATLGSFVEGEGEGDRGEKRGTGRDP
ncbi:hypothetical protein JXB02_04695 [Candidatus Woesearchaeota archaeon]|nr:hypothetical protein [Candidatus Woesearchaeota archaeon]